MKKATPKRVVHAQKPRPQVAIREPKPEDPYGDVEDRDDQDRVEIREDREDHETPEATPPSERDEEDRDEQREQAREQLREQRQRDRDREHEQAVRSGAQSFGLPWAGQLAHPTRLRVPERAVIRRPWRAFATRTTVDFLRHAIEDTLDTFPRVHVLAVGDLTSEHGGNQTDHHSHQSGRDADIGFFYKKKPANYPSEFVPATEANLDCAATFALISNFARTAGEDGGVQVMYLDYNVQGILYRWAKEHGVSESRLDRMFEYPHGKGSRQGLIHHYRNHHHHVHVRFRCSKADSQCQ